MNYIECWIKFNLAVREIFMTKKISVIAIIPARGGSKGIPGKNTKIISGKPLIAHTILEAGKVSLIDRIIVNTDDDSIARVAKEYGAEVFKRPAKLAGDLTLDLEVFEHHLKSLKDSGELPDIVVDLRATAPLRKANRIEQGIKLLIEAGRTKADSVRAVSKTMKHPFKMWTIKGKFISPFLPQEFTRMKEPYNAARQLLPEVYQNNGCANAFWPETVLVKKSMTGEKILGFVMDDWESVNIDTPLDFIIAEKLMEIHK